jgi:hypothetical protein
MKRGGVIYLRNQYRGVKMPSERLVTPMGLLQIHAEDYVQSSSQLTPLQTLLVSLTTPGKEKTKKRIFKHFVETSLERLPDEMSTKIYFQLPHARKELFEEPRKPWEEVIARFPNAIQDIDEAAKCFALSRYAACVFHCVQIIEHGLLPLWGFSQR